MAMNKLYEVLDSDKLKSWWMLSMNEMGINTLEKMKYDKIVQNLAKKTYKQIPLIPFIDTTGTFLINPLV